MKYQLTVLYKCRSCFTVRYSVSTNPFKIIRFKNSVFSVSKASVNIEYKVSPGKSQSTKKRKES